MVRNFIVYNQAVKCNNMDLVKVQVTKAPNKHAKNIIAYLLGTGYR